MLKIHTCTYTHFRCTAGTFIRHTSSTLQTEDGACGHPEAPLARPGVCTPEMYRGIIESDGREGANGFGDRNGHGSGVGGSNGDVNGDGDGAGTGTGKGVETQG